jgi:hypothetical protein
MEGGTPKAAATALPEHANRHDTLSAKTSATPSAPVRGPSDSARLGLMLLVIVSSFLVACDTASERRLLLTSPVAGDQTDVRLSDESWSLSGGAALTWWP